MIYKTIAATLLLLSSASFGCDSSSVDSSYDACPTLVSEFSAADAGGVDGTIQAIYTDPSNPLKATIRAELDLSQLDTQAIQKQYPNCSYPYRDFLWHIHVRWGTSKPSGFLSDCSAEQTGGHYDPTFACGPASQYGKDTTCTVKQSEEFAYACSPESFQSHAINCEMGDFSGKFGPLRVNEHGKVHATYHDFMFPTRALYNQPMYLEPEVHWNFLLHLKCPEHKNPRISCARLNIAKKEH